MIRFLLCIVFCFFMTFSVCMANEKDKDAQIFFNSASKKMKAYDYQGAIDDYTKYTYLYPNNVFVYINRGFAYSYQGNYDAAIVDWSKCIEISKNKNDDLSAANCSFYRGKGYFTKKEYEKSIYDLKLAKELFAKQNVVSNNQEIDKYLQLASTKIEEISDADIYLTKAKDEFNNGDFKKACEYMDSAIKIKPKNAYYYELRAIIKANMGEYKDAAEDAQKSKKIYYSQGNIKKAEKMESMLKSINAD